MSAKEQSESRVDCGRWRLGREIGHGAYGTVYAATNGRGECAAVKVCRRDAIGGERCGRELRGARLYSSIPTREGLVRMRELAVKSWGFYAVMDLADDEFGGGRMVSAEYRPKTLARVIEGEKALSLCECVKLGITLAKGLETLQRHHLLHRDIKPGNVIYVGGKPVLSDPGLVVEESEAGSLVGTPGYAPPENFIDAAGDVYSLGLTLKAASFGRRIEDVDKGPALEADTGAKSFPAWWRILNKATDPMPSRRYQSAKALVKDLESLRNKMAFASIAGSRAAKVAIALAVVGAAAIVVSSIAASRRMKDEIDRQTATIAPLKDNLAKQSAENKSLKDAISRQSEENKSLKDDLSRQSDEIKSLKADLVRHPAETEALKDALDRQSKENQELKDAISRQAEENQSLKDDISKQSDEIKSLKADLVKQPAGNRALKDALDMQSRENEKLKEAMASQTKLNNWLKDDLAKQSKEIKILQFNLAKKAEKAEQPEKKGGWMDLIFGRSRSDDNAALERMVANSLRDTFDGVLSEERAKEEAKRVVAGGDVQFTPEELQALSGKTRTDFGVGLSPKGKGK